MNIYKITYIIGSEDGGTDTTEIIERSEAAARKRFKVFSKAGTITDVELIRENVSATKEQERETLEKIKAMVAELGPNSYVATAFEGCLEIAEQNIEYDAADSLKERNELVDKENRELKEKLAASQSDVEVLRSQLKHTESKLRAVNVGVGEPIQKDDERKDALARMAGQLEEARSSAGDAQRRAEEAETLVVQLKAKLYDYMTA